MTCQKQECLPLRYRAVSENEWLFPADSLGTPSDLVFAEAARGGNVLFQILTDFVLTEDAPFSFSVDGANGVTVTPYRLLPVRVAENSAPRGQMRTTTDYESVKDFVTRKAPFEVYDVTAPTEDGILTKGRVALAFRLQIASAAPVGEQRITLTVGTSLFSLQIPVRLTVHKATVPPLSESRLSVCNWIYPERIAEDHGVAVGSEDYFRIFRTYLRHQLDIRSNTFASINTFSACNVGVIRDGEGKIVDFDLSFQEREMRIAREMGFRYIEGPFVAHWVHWTDEGLWLLWDRETEVGSVEAYRQLRIYFARVREMVERNGWRDCYLQTLVDEPQIYSEPSYRTLSGVCRKFLPGIPISDPIETTDIGGAVDVMCVKQAIYEKYIDTFRAYQEMGERMTYYTCGFPAGDHLNRVLDLPLPVGRLTFWMCHRYGFEGFLHWGYHVTEPTGPEGNQRIVYPMGNGVAESVRSHGQRVGAEDWELLEQIRLHDPAAADRLVARGCRTFTDYERDPAVIEAIRHEILVTADRFAD